MRFMKNSAPLLNGSFRLLNRFLILFVCSHCFADDCPSALKEERPATWRSKLRVKTLTNLDQFLNWSFSAKLKTYALITPMEEKKIEVEIPEMASFVENYGYFSLRHPMVGVVTSSKRDLRRIECLLRGLYEEEDNIDYLGIAIPEILTKVLAYHDLKPGQTITIPIEIDDKLSLEQYTVDRIFNLWHGMPAFGLVPDREGADSILIFRGTDFSPSSVRGWASLMSDLDLSGPGLSAFQHSQDELSLWLQIVNASGKPARVLGFSLGGALAAYTFIYENQWLSNQGSISLCAPGIREKVISEWRLLAPERQEAFTSLVNRGDIIPKVGRLFGTVYMLFTDATYKPLTAHTQLMSSEPLFYKAKVDVQKENDSR